MKKLRIVIALILVSSSGLHAQSERMNAVKMNVFSPFVQTFSMFYERALNEESSLQLGFFYTGFSINDTKISGFGITPEYRYYFSDKGAMRGLYFAPFIRYQNFTLKNTYDDTDSNGNITEVTDKGTLSTFGGGVLFGHQWLFNGKVALDLFVGPSYGAGEVSVDSGSEDTFDTGSFSGFSIRAGACVGIAF
ncbi:MAG TPA: DUF3575 domain-containing protein [Bacteroidia bacterium]|nr:DUF3575 domain-containing protein [Bacteroidia bacterium]HNT80906.1 DUF3575 domain-containing protein [Bacteroidia bacterium]